MLLVVLKSLCLVVLLALSTVAGFLPLKLKSIRPWIATGLACFCGGLLLGVCFLDFLPSTRHMVCREPSTTWSSYPVTELLIMSGFLLVMSLDKVAEALSSQMVADKRTAPYAPQSRTDTATEDLVNTNHDEENKPLLQSQAVNIYGSESRLVDSNTIAVKSMKKHNEVTVMPWFRSRSLGTALRSVALVAAVTVHSVLEGMVIGLEDSQAKVIQLTALVTFHKSLIFFSVGTTLNDHKVGLSLYAKEIALLCLASPGGALVGMLVTSLDSDVEYSLAAITLKCLATGTFIFVAFFEILSKKLIVESPRDLINVLYCIAGFACFAGVTAIPDAR